MLLIRGPCPEPVTLWQQRLLPRAQLCNAPRSAHWPLLLAKRLAQREPSKAGGVFTPAAGASQMAGAPAADAAGGSDWGGGGDASGNEASAWAIEHYGLPGDKYHCGMAKDHMDFIFEDECDAIILNLRWL